MSQNGCKSPADLLIEDLVERARRAAQFLDKAEEAHRSAHATLRRLRRGWWTIGALIAIWVVLVVQRFVVPCP
jgi:hypothetical protein